MKSPNLRVLDNSQSHSTVVFVAFLEKVTFKLSPLVPESRLVLRLGIGTVTEKSNLLSLSIMPPGEVGDVGVVGCTRSLGETEEVGCGMVGCSVVMDSSHSKDPFQDSMDAKGTALVFSFAPDPTAPAGWGIVGLVNDCEWSDFSGFKVAGMSKTRSVAIELTAPAGCGIDGFVVDKCEVSVVSESAMFIGSECPCIS